MEKIYMEDSSNQSSKYRKSSSIRLSVVLSFVVAFFAVFSLIACGVSQVSYAAPEDGNGGSNNQNQSGISTINFRMDSHYLTAFGANDSYFNIPIYYTESISDRTTLLCIEPHAEVVVGIDYNTSGSIDDYGLLYLMSQFYNEDGSNKLVVDSATYGDDTIYVDAFVKQASVWAYLTKKNGNDGNLSAEEYNIVTGGNSIKIVSSDGGSYYVQNATSLFSLINQFVASAESATNVVKLQLTEIASVSLKDDGDYQITYKITNTPSNVEVYSYSIDVSSEDVLNSVDGKRFFKIVDSNGNAYLNNKITCVNGSCPDEFTIVIDKDFINEKNKNYNFDVSIEGKYKSLSGAKFSAVGRPELQKVITVNGTDKYENATADFSIVTSEDTGMSSAQTIYFIGLVVLLCGIGIVYANAKPAESK